MSVDDTFVFAAEQQRLHGVGGVQRGRSVIQRAKSDVSSFYLRPSAGAAAGGHRQQASDIFLFLRSPGCLLSACTTAVATAMGMDTREMTHRLSRSPVVLSYARHGTMVMTMYV